MKCKFCGHEKLEGEVFCTQCGKDDQGRAPIVTKAVDADIDQSDTTEMFGPALMHKTITLAIGEARLNVDIQEQIILGRADASNPEPPDLDLIPYDAVDKGVSRRHARIERQRNTLFIVDMGSANGTFINDRRLPSNQPSVVRSGDEIRLARLAIQIYFT